MKTLLILIAPFLIFALAYIIEPPQPKDLEYVDKVVDGDTINIGDEKIRLADIDTPESSKYRYGHVECFGEEATEYLKNLINNQPISIERHGKDKYGRTLATIHFNDININEDLIIQGYADTYGDRYETQKEQAISEGEGLWGECK